MANNVLPTTMICTHNGDYYTFFLTEILPILITINQTPVWHRLGSITLLAMNPASLRNSLPVDLIKDSFTECPRMLCCMFLIRAVSLLRRNHYSSAKLVYYQDDRKEYSIELSSFLSVRLSW